MDRKYKIKFGKFANKIWEICTQNLGNLQTKSRFQSRLFGVKSSGSGRDRDGKKGSGSRGFGIGIGIPVDHCAYTTFGVCNIQSLVYAIYNLWCMHIQPLVYAIYNLWYMQYTTFGVCNIQPLVYVL